MSMTKTSTEKSVIYTFDGFSEGYGAYVEGAFVGAFIVPKQHAHRVLEGDGYEVECLRELHASKRYGIRLVGARKIT